MNLGPFEYTKKFFLMIETFIDPQPFIAGVSNDSP